MARRHHTGILIKGDRLLGTLFLAIDLKGFIEGSQELGDTEIVLNIVCQWQEERCSIMSKYKDKMQLMNS